MPPKKPSTNSKKSKAPYEVGYGKPPKHTQFKPGQSGNPKGRPRGQRNLSTMFKDVLNETIVVREGDRTRKVPKAVAVLTRVLDGALRGDHKATSAYFQFIRTLNLLQDEQEVQDGGVAIDDKAIIAEFLARNGIGGADADETLSEPRNGDGANDDSPKEDE